MDEAEGEEINRRLFFRVVASWLGSLFSPKPVLPISTYAGVNSVLTRSAFERFTRDAFRYSSSKKTMLIARPNLIEAIAKWERRAPIVRDSVPQRHSIDRVRDALHAKREMRHVSSRSVAFYGQDEAAFFDGRFKKKRARRGRDKHRGRDRKGAGPDPARTCSPAPGTQ